MKELCGVAVPEKHNNTRSEPLSVFAFILKLFGPSVTSRSLTLSSIGWCHQGVRVSDRHDLFYSLTLNQFSILSSEKETPKQKASDRSGCETFGFTGWTEISLYACPWLVAEMFDIHLQILLCQRHVCYINVTQPTRTPRINKEAIIYTYSEITSVSPWLPSRTFNSNKVGCFSLCKVSLLSFFNWFNSNELLWLFTLSPSVIMPTVKAS